MSRLLKLLGTLAASGLVGLTLQSPATFANQSRSAQSFRMASRYTYSSSLVSRYTAGCTPKVQSRGRSLAQARQACQCSLDQMQQQHSQGEAVALLIRAQFSASTDPKTGLPSALSRYFTPCMS